ncbi:MAG: aryl-sulfate sulfotransferase [Bacteroidota bacterium]
MMVLNLQTISQTQTMGVFINDTSKVFKGYTLFAPKQNTMTYLIDNQGRKVHDWTASTYAPGQAVYLLDNGHLLRTCMTQGNLGTGGGEGGRIEEYDWDDHLVWSLDYSTTTYMQHHDIKKLPNGNIIMLVVEKKTMAQVEAAGFDTSTFQPDARQKGFILPDCIIEIQPTYPTGGTKVWEWHVWDHLIQNHDATKLNYGTPSLHPELIDCAGDHRVKPLFWNHMNAIDYNPALDQIVMSVRGNSELWVIDHNTSTAQATGHSGGAHGKGGDLLYRWGNPQCYGIGTQSNEKYFEQHDVEWIKTNCPGAGNLLCFNNGVNRNYSSIDEIIPPIDLSGNYTYTTGTSFGPSSNCWTFNFTSPDTVYAHDISGAQRLPNGNTIACAGPFGALYEITATGQIVWKYISPVTDKGPLNQGMAIPHNPIRPEETMNSIFRVYKYPPTYAGFAGHNLVAGNVIELLPLGMNTVLLNDANALQVYPNPFSSVLNVLNAKSCVTYTITNSMGQVIWSGDHIETQDFSWLKAGMYFLNVNETVNSRVIKLLKQ